METKWLIAIVTLAGECHYLRGTYRVVGRRDTLFPARAFAAIAAGSGKSRATLQVSIFAGSGGAVGLARRYRTKSPTRKQQFRCFCSRPGSFSPIDIFMCLFCVTNKFRTGHNNKGNREKQSASSELDT